MDKAQQVGKDEQVAEVRQIMTRSAAARMNTHVIAGLSSEDLDDIHAVAATHAQGVANPFEQEQAQGQEKGKRKGKEKKRRKDKAQRKEAVEEDGKEDEDEEEATITPQTARWKQGLRRRVSAPWTVQSDVDAINSTVFDIGAVHLITTRVQHMLEQSAFNFTRAHDPNTFAQIGSSEALELNVWLNELTNSRSLLSKALNRSADTLLLEENAILKPEHWSAVLRAVAQIRHCAVHRCVAETDVLLEWIAASLHLLDAMGDRITLAKLSRVQAVIMSAHAQYANQAAAIESLIEAAGAKADSDAENLIDLKNAALDLRCIESQKLVETLNSVFSGWENPRRPEGTDFIAF